MDELWGAIFALIGVAIAVIVAFWITVTVLSFIGTLVVLPIDYVAHGFVRLGVHSPAVSWLVLGATVGGLIGLSMGLAQSGLRGGRTVALLAAPASVIALLIASSRLGNQQEPWFNTAATVSVTTPADTTAVMPQYDIGQHRTRLREANSPSTTVIGGIVTPAPAAPLPPQPNTGVLRVASTPVGATIEVDGVSQGSTPLTLTLDPGEHAVHVTMAGWIESTRTASVRTGATTNVSVALLCDPVTCVAGDWTGTFNGKPMHLHVASVALAGAGSWQVSATASVALADGSKRTFELAGTLGDAPARIKLTDQASGYEFAGQWHDGGLEGTAHMQGVGYAYTWNVTR